jgi:hypothetical protein
LRNSLNNETEEEVDLKTTHKLRSDESSNKYTGPEISLSSPGGSGQFLIDTCGRSNSFDVNLATGKEKFSDP